MTPWPLIIYEHVERALGELDPTFRLKDIAISNPQKATTYMDRGLAIGIPTSLNQPNSRDADYGMTSHTVLVTLSNTIKMLAQKESYKQALDDGETIRKTITEYTPAAADVRFSWVSTTRAFTASGDYVITTLTFNALTCASRR